MNPFFKKIMSGQRGMATLEILLAMAFMVMVICAVVPMVSGSQSTSVDTQTNQEALAKAQALLENARANAALDFNLVNPLAAVDDNIYQKSLLVEQVNLFTKKVTAKVSWQAEGNRSLNVSLSTLLTNSGAVDGGNTCSSVLTGNWSSPQSKSIALPDAQNTITGIDVNRGKLYVTAGKTSGTGNDFYIYTITDPKNPVLLGALDTGPGLKGVAVAGNYAYVANTSRLGQLQVINVQNPGSPVLVASYKIPGVSGTGNQALGNAIFYANKKVYLGLTKGTGQQFHVINVSNPESPQYVGKYEAGDEFYIHDEQ